MYPGLLGCRFIDHVSKDLFLGSLFRLIDLHMFLCQYHTILIILQNYSFVYSLISSGCMIPPTLFYSKISLAIWSLLWFHINVRISCSDSEKNDIGILIRTALNLCITLDSKDILTILILPIHEQGIYPSIYLYLLNFFCHCHSFQDTSLSSFLLNFLNL